MRWNLPRVMTLSPCGEGDPGVVVAASRAGALGVFDFGFGAEGGEVRRSIEAAAHFLKGRPFGIRLGLEDAAAEGDFAALADPLRAIVIRGGGLADEAAWALAIGRVRASGRIAIAEVTSRGAAWAAAG